MVETFFVKNAKESSIHVITIIYEKFRSLGMTYAHSIPLKWEGGHFLTLILTKHIDLKIYIYTSVPQSQATELLTASCTSSNSVLRILPTIIIARLSIGVSTRKAEQTAYNTNPIHIPPDL